MEINILEKLPEEEETKRFRNMVRNLSLDSNMSQVYIDNRLSDKLNGKTIEKTSFYNSYGNNYDENHLVIKFTDGTYVLVTIEKDEEGIHFGQHMPDAKHFSPEALGYVVGDEFKYNDWCQQLIDIGVFNHIPEETLKATILEHKRRKELYEYKRYKELEAKYKDYNPTEDE